MKLGDRNVKAVMLGGRPVKKILLGDRLVWEAEPDPPASGLWTDFSEYTLGQRPSDWSYSHYYNETSQLDWAIEEVDGTPGGRALRAQFTSIQGVGIRGLKWDLVDSAPDKHADVEVLALLRQPPLATAHMALHARYNGAGGTYAAVAPFGGGFNLGRTNGAATSSFAAIGTQEGSFTAGSWWWFRFRLQGTNLKLKTWLDGDPEPGAWLIERSDTTYTAAGGAGVYLFRSSTNPGIEVGYFSVAFGGDVALGPWDNG